MVLPPSLKANRWNFSKAIDTMSVSVMVVYSPGINISWNTDKKKKVWTYVFDGLSLA